TPAIQIVCERRAGRPDPIEIALEHGGHREPPMRETEDDAVDPPQLTDEGRDLVLRIASLIVTAPFGLAHDGPEALAVEVGRDHLMARAEGSDNGVEQGVVIAVFNWMAMNDLD